MLILDAFVTNTILASLTQQLHVLYLLVANQLGIDNLLGLIIAGVHEPYPLHLIGDLQLVRCTGIVGQGGQELLHSGEGGILKLQDQLVIEDQAFRILSSFSFHWVVDTCQYTGSSKKSNGFSFLAEHSKIYWALAESSGPEQYTINVPQMGGSGH